MNELETAVIKTLAYADLFEQALRRDEVVTYCIKYPIKNGHEIDKLASSKITVKNNCYVLVGREGLIPLKSSQDTIVGEKVYFAQQWQWVFKLVPWIKLVAITGSIAGGTPKPDDDIDLLVITDARRLWLSRIILTILLNVTGKRRKPTDNPNNVNNKFCLNMWLSMQSLEEQSHDIYTANELANIIPLLSRQGAYEHYLRSNAWIKKLLPSFYNQLSKSSDKFDFNAGSKYSPLSVLDKIAEKLQRKIMRRPTNETIKDSRLAFHPHDYRTEILAKYEQRLNELGLKS